MFLRVSSHAITRQPQRPRPRLDIVPTQRYTAQAQGQCLQLVHRIYHFGKAVVYPHLKHISMLPAHVYSVRTRVPYCAAAFAGAGAAARGSAARAERVRHRGAPAGAEMQVSKQFHLVVLGEPPAGCRRRASSLALKGSPGLSVQWVMTNENLCERAVWWLDRGPDNRYCPPPVSSTVRRMYLLGNLCKQGANTYIQNSRVEITRGIAPLPRPVRLGPFELSSLPPGQDCQDGLCRYFVGFRTKN